MWVLFCVFAVLRVFSACADLILRFLISGQPFLSLIHVITYSRAYLRYSRGDKQWVGGFVVVVVVVVVAAAAMLQHVFVLSCLVLVIVP